MPSTVSSVGFGSWPWVRRLRLVAAVALLWAGLRFAVGGALLPAGLDRPATLAAAQSTVLAALAVTALLWLGAYAGTIIAGARHRGQGLVVASLALAAWPIGGGTLDAWLLLSARDGAVGPPSADAYWPLVVEYVFLAVVVIGAAAAGSLAVSAVDAPDSGASRVRWVFGLDADRRRRGQGLLALLSATVVIGVLMLVLTGPVVGQTLRGQVYFAIAAATAIGVFVASRLVTVRHSIWYWPAPILAGLIGVLAAAFKPDLFIPPEYDQLNSIPAWGLARPLPMEMVGVGVAVSLWTLRAVTGGSQPERV